MAEALWAKDLPLDLQLHRFTVGQDPVTDLQLMPFDTEGSAAHARMLGATGLLPEAEARALVGALRRLRQEALEGSLVILPEEEDCHTALEHALTERLGDTGKRIHLGRSRNDQVLTAIRLYLLEASAELAAAAESAATALDRLAARQGHVELPGYTHMQQAMPSSVALWAGGYASELRDDAAGLLAVRRRAGRNPLGSAAGYGAPGLPLDRAATTRALGFDSVHEPVTAVQLSRGKAEAQLLFELTLTMQDLGRLAADLLLFYTQEFAFVALPDAYTTGSSIMPQKRNPDVFELMRGRSASAQACLAEALALCAKLPSGYQRDLQLLKVPLFRGIDLAQASLDIVVPALDALSFRPERIRLDPAVHAANEAYALVLNEGLPFREAYRRVAARLQEKKD